MKKEEQIQTLVLVTREIGELNILIRQSEYCLRILQRLASVVNALNAEKEEEEKKTKEASGLNDKTFD